MESPFHFLLAQAEKHGLRCCCLEGYRMRGLEDPHCRQHDLEDFLREVVVPMVEEELAVTPVEGNS